MRTVFVPAGLPSSSTRGTWIEIGMSITKIALASGRPPHGGRGLKSQWYKAEQNDEWRSSSTRGTWIEIIDSFSEYLYRGVVLHTGDVD